MFMPVLPILQAHNCDVLPILQAHVYIRLGVYFTYNINLYTITCTYYHTYALFCGQMYLTKNKIEHNWRFSEISSVRLKTLKGHDDHVVCYFHGYIS